MVASPGYNTSYHIDSKLDGPRVLITAGVHGDEYEPMLAALALTSHLQDRLKTGSVTIVPVVNPGAYAAGSRTGDDGLDLARICPGDSAGSSSARAAAAVSMLIRKADYYIDMHTGGRLFDIYPLAGYMLHTSPEILTLQQEMAKAFNLPVIWGTDDSLDGRTLSVARDANVPAIYIEYGGGSAVRNEIVEAYKQGCLQVLTGLKMMDPESGTAPLLQYWVEDYTPENGHLQSKMPAPSEGIFVPAVVTGDKISEGQLWGYIMDPHSGRRETVTATNDGIVLFLRVVPLVKKGDSLGGILPISKPGKVVIS
ncbi:M14 family metallopeptidase [Chitinophaga sp. MM2321]|uniref:succinylglutamate desuccinylase/aspartoacylase family protein n=1 Tax=Chitinophaga sp. MM2321 TaxID=3137178 RepID=UPI0032D57803